jgi:hypothetical protein
MAAGADFLVLLYQQRPIMLPTALSNLHHLLSRQMAPMLQHGVEITAQMLALD